ncbi:MAG: hypothetical protein JW760_03785 [Spirochaetales bacterium]|nr:hypothetical protein [Spirochaetales bacterium]
MNTSHELSLPGSFVKTASFAAIIQPAVLLIGLVVTAGASFIPSDAPGFFTLMNESPLMGFLMDDFFSVLLITLYLFTFPALFLILMKRHFTLSFYGALLSVIAVILTLSVHTGFSLLHLNGEYRTAVDDAMRSQVLAAGTAILAGNIWNSTAGFFAGVFLQGGGVLMSAAMIGSGRFRRLTIISGLLANGLDLMNHLSGHWLPALAKILLFIGGPFYIIWYVMLFLDLRCLYKNRGKPDVRSD